MSRREGEIHGAATRAAERNEANEANVAPMLEPRCHPQPSINLLLLLVSINRLMINRSPRSVVLEDMPCSIIQLVEMNLQELEVRSRCAAILSIE
mgnify:CR=1 FL=1